nr:hypothetical protein Iba_chr04cCG18080 [Ipomoea batatas]
MNLNCMADPSPRTDSTPKLSPRSTMSRSPSFSLWLGRMERTNTGNLSQRPVAGEKGRKSGKFRSSSEGHGCWSTPRLVRCFGIKKGWILEDPSKAVKDLQKHKR